MSPSWRDQLQVFFAPEQVGLVRFLRGFKPTVIEETFEKCERKSGQQLWEPPLQLLEKMLNSAKRTDMTITLSNHYVRYVTLLPQNEITTPDEVFAYASYRMQEIYAHRVSQWMLSVSAWNPLNGAICAAVPIDLVNQIQELAARYNIKIKEIKPYLVSAVNHWHQTFDDPYVCFAQVEPGRFCVAMITDNIWHNLRNQRILDNVENELLAALDQEAILHGHKKNIDTVYLFAPEFPGLALPENCGWKTVPVADMLPAPLYFPSVRSNLSRQAHA